ncbi:MAG: arginine--tRNA ligase [Deltaproteobacteria bacterium]|nr:arginine--tRNA ligase [Deltaproteobacteria bacterium]
MSSSPSAQNLFARAAADAVARITGVAADFKVEAPPRPELGDFAVGCFAAAKALKQAPPAVAAKVAAEFQPTELLSAATATGPFVNFRANRAAGFRWLIDATLGGGALVPQTVGAGQTVCIDFSSPNISKHLAYHHIRSTVIGHALVNLNRAIGARVIGINHLGDWGTTHGMVMAAYKKWGAPEPLDVTAINDLYVRFREAMKADPTVEQEGRVWFKKLEDGDAEARALWQRFRDISWAEFESAYQMMDITFDEVRGESAYEPELPGVLAMLRDKGLVSESEGAQVAVLPDEKNPVLLVTRDGTTLYATRDVAAAMYRWNTYGFTRSLYVVDRGQGLHFKQLFKLLALAGYEWSSRCEHVPFGLVRIAGKKTGTRTGNITLLKAVFAEAIDEVAPMMRANAAKIDAQISDAEIERTATMVGVGAIVFANLLPQREKDVDFDLEKVTSLSGDSGPYLQYSHARCVSIQRKGGVPIEHATLTPEVLARLGNDHEWAVARRLLDFGEIVARAAAASEPHLLCHYMLELAGDFSRWYTAGNEDAGLRVLCEDLELRRARVALVGAVQATLKQGLGILGLGAPDVM